MNLLLFAWVCRRFDCPGSLRCSAVRFGLRDTKRSWFLGRQLRLGDWSWAERSHCRLSQTRFVPYAQRIRGFGCVSRCVGALVPGHLLQSSLLFLSAQLIEVICQVG